MSTGKFKMKLPPDKPRRVKKFFTLDLGSEISLSFKELTGLLAREISRRTRGCSGYEYLTQEWLCANLDKIILNLDPYYDYEERSVSISVDESEDEFQARLDWYEAELEKYEKWKDKNAKEIAEVAAAQEEKKKAKLAKEKDFLERQLKTTQAKLNKIAAEEAMRR